MTEGSCGQAIDGDNCGWPGPGGLVCCLVKLAGFGFWAEVGSPQHHHASPYHEQLKTHTLLYYIAETLKYIRRFLINKVVRGVVEECQPQPRTKTCHVF